jgi:pimeloyl-ACP methyl ester carboxylesterase
MKSLLLIISLNISTLCLSQTNHQIGHYNITFQDPNRSNRDIETEIYYPATTTGNNTTVATGQFPVIVFGHGFVMAWDAYENLWEEFVPNGYIMVFPRTEGSLFSTDHQQFGWDLQFLVSKIQDEGNNINSTIYNAVANNTALMGHSMGGGASFLAAESLCVNGNNQLKTIIGLAPAESSSNGVSSIASATNITVPSVILSGSQDGVTPPIDHHIPMYDSLSSNCKTFISVSGGAHCYFANSNFNCDFGESTSSTGISITRSEQHSVTFDFINLWLDYSLKNDCDDFFTFQDSLNNSNRISHNQSCLQNPTASISENGGVLTCSITGIGYQWYLNNIIIPGANSINYTPIVSGNYTVEVNFSIGCPTLSSLYNFLLSSIFNNVNYNNKIHIYPNPTSNKITLDLYDTHDNITINIRTITGELVSIKKYNSIKKINLEINEDPGIYIVEITNQVGNSVWVKVVKQ